METTDFAAHPFLAGMTPDALARLSQCARLVDFPRGARIFDEGGPAQGFWLIVDGHVMLDTFLPGVGTVIIETLGAGTVLGWSWLFPPYVWHFGATAVKPTAAIELDAAAVRQRCDSDPAVGYELHRRFMPVVVDRLQATRVRLLDLYRLS